MKIFIKINRNIKLMYLFLKFVTFVEMETFGFGGKWLCLDIFLRILKVGRTVHITILMQFLKEMFVFR